MEITDRVVGIFDTLNVDQTAQFHDELEVYGLTPITFSLAQLLKVGLDPAWVWKAVRWPRKSHVAYVREVEKRLDSELGVGLADDSKRQINMLKLVQAGTKKLGNPIRLEGEVDAIGGTVQKVFVYPTGVIAYNRTPHPMGILRAVASVADTG